MTAASEAHADSSAGRWAVRNCVSDRLVATNFSHDVAVDVKGWLTSCFPSNHYQVERDDVMIVAEVQPDPAPELFPGTRAALDNLNIRPEVQ